MSEIVYGKTPLGQLLYDLAFTDLSPHYLARKHCLPINEVRRLRAAALKGLRPKRRPRKHREVAVRRAKELNDAIGR